MADVNHSSRKHALLSASGASRWLNCTPSARLEERFDESAQSSYAAEGTLAHEFGDINLRFANGEISKRVFETELKRLRKEEYYSPEMEIEVEKYTTYCLEVFNVARSNTPDATMLVEERFDFSDWVEQGFGTGDCSVIADGVLDIMDLKYGKGIKVDAHDNPQLKLYALGALRAFELMYDIHTIRMHIIQPRLDHISEFEISVDALLKWGDVIVKPKAAKAYAGKGVQKAGDWCKWCKVEAMCATLAAKNVKLAQHEFKDPHLLTDQQIVDVFKQQPMLVDWVNAVSKYMVDEALKGKQWPGYKLVEGRSQRKWKSEEMAIETLKEEEFDENDFMVKKLKGITAIEKLVGKNNIGAMLGDCIIKPAGKPTLAPSDDPRPAMGIEQAKEDFKD